MIKVYLKEDFFVHGLSVYVIDEHEGYRRLLQPGGGPHATSWIEWERGSAVFDAEPVPSFTMPLETGRALLEALVRHYQGAEDTRQLRKDYDAERQRVDSLTNALVDIARASAERGFRA